MRTDPTTSSEILITLETGDYVFGVLISAGGGEEALWVDGHHWIAASVAGYDGYIAADFMTPAP
jgi:hypothetical protein